MSQTRSRDLKFTIFFVAFVVLFLSGNALDTATFYRDKWGPHFIDSDADIPINKFKGFYFNRRRPTNVIATNEVDYPTINYGWSDFHGIGSKMFGAYWVGNLKFERDEDREILIHQGHSNTKLYINDELIFSGDSEKRLLHTFRKGLNKVEVEYINGWHTTTVSVIIRPIVKVYDNSTAKEQLRKIVKPESEIYYVGAYESSDLFNRVTVKLKATNHPVVLFLSSYNPVLWIIDNTYDVDIDAIVYRENSLIKYAENETSKTFAIKELPTAHKVRQLRKISRAIHTITGQSLTGFAGEYDISVVPVPEYGITEEAISRLPELTEPGEMTSRKMNLSDKIFSDDLSVEELRRLEAVFEER